MVLVKLAEASLGQFHIHLRPRGENSRYDDSLAKPLPVWPQMICRRQIDDCPCVQQPSHAQPAAYLLSTLQRAW